MGRESTSDILLLLPQISRQHAQLVEDMHGDHWLMDLDSSNGTWIGTHRISRQLLLPGTVFNIGDVHLIYEDDPQPPPADATGHVRAVSYRQAAGRRRTRELCYAGQWSQEPAVGEGEASQDLSRTLVVEALGEDGSRYDGCLVDDLSEYRGLRLRASRCGLDTTKLLDRFQQVEKRLWKRLAARGLDATAHGPPGFACRLPAGLRFADGSCLVVSVRWLGLGGLEIVAPRPLSMVHEVVWVAFELVLAGWPRTVVLTCRVTQLYRENACLSIVGLSDEYEAVQQAYEHTWLGSLPEAASHESRSRACRA